MRNPPSGERDVICFAGQDWWYHNRAHSDFQLMRRIAGHRKVLFINSIGMRMPLPGRSTQFGRRILRKMRSMTRLARRVDPDRPGFIVFTPLLLPAYSFAFIRAMNARLVAAQVRLLQRIYRVKDPVGFLTVPTSWDVAQHLSLSATVFNRSDKQSAFPEVNGPMIESLEQDLLAGADAVVYVSHVLMATERGRAGGEVVFLDHGVDLEHFARQAPPVEIQGLARPIVGFFGGIDNYTVDVGLLEEVAIRTPDATLLLVGAADSSMARLTRHSNVVWLGPRPYAQIPALGSAFDVALMPWLPNEWIQYCNPIKMKEYLALGLPIVTMPFPETAQYAPLLDIADSHVDFVHLVHERLRHPLSEEDRTARRAAVMTASWDVRAGQLLALFDRLACQ